MWRCYEEPNPRDIRTASVVVFKMRWYMQRKFFTGENEHNPY